MIKSSRTTTKASAVFLATVLLAGTIALSAPSFMIGTAQAQPYYDREMDNRYNSYGSDYGNDNRYNSYGSDYGMDNNDKRSYGNDYGYESQYQPSYKPDYKPAYPSYGKDKDDRDKSKDKSVDIKKVKCNNININLNDGQGGTGSGDNGNTTDRKDNKTDGFKKINRDGFTFICINNNNNEAGAGNVTEPEPEPVEEGCEECFDNLTVDLKVILNRALEEGFEIGPLNVTAGSSIADLCDELDSVAPLEISILDVIGFIFREGITNDEDVLSFLNLLICLQALDLIDVDIFSLRAALIQQGLITP